MAIFLPSWPVDLVRRSDRRAPRQTTIRPSPPPHAAPDPARDARPLLVVATEGQRRIVVDRCERAAAAGVRPGMVVAQARALFGARGAGASGAHAGVRCVDHDARRAASALRALAAWAQRFSPIVSVDEADDDGLEPRGLLLDITGCARVWKGEERLAREAVRGLRAVGVRARVAIAPTFAAAWAIARFGMGDDAIRVVERERLREAIAPLPTASLRAGCDVETQLAEVGIVRIGELLELPRSAVPARFGGGLLVRLDRMLGGAIETIEPVRPLPPPAVERVFEGPTKRIDAIEHTVRELLSELCDELSRRGAGARALAVDLSRSDLGPETLTVTLGRPSCDAVHLWSLVRPRLERAHLGFGVEAVSVRAPTVGALRHHQATHPALRMNGPGSASGVNDGAHDDGKAAGELIDTLSNRLGERRVLCARAVESHLPERASELVPAARAAAERTPKHRPAVAANDRPSVLFPRPIPARVISVSPDGPVHRVAWRGGESAITASIGPERLGGEWWRVLRRAGEGDDERGGRDCFAVREESGRWLWLARSLRTGEWFVHGVWA
jgi:protein ImuB